MLSTWGEAGRADPACRQPHAVLPCWAAYIATLPSDYSQSHPLYFSKDTLAYAQQSDVSRRLRCDMLRAEKSYMESKTFVRDYVNATAERESIFTTISVHTDGVGRC